MVRVHTIALAVTLTAASRAPHAGLSVTIDISPALAVLDAVTGDTAGIEVRADSIIGLPAIQAMIAKEHRHHANATAAAFRSDLLSAAHGGRTLVVPLDAIRQDPANVRRLLDELAV